MNQIFMTFITYSFIGWLWETIYCLFKYHRFVFCGVLLGPYCPVYGFGISSVLILTDGIQNLNNPIILYLVIVLIVSVIEYIGSWILERLFNMKLWDYSNLPLNIQGRVALPISLFWGVGGILLIKYINPVIQNHIDDINRWVVLAIFVIFIIDVISTFGFTMSAKKDFMPIINSSDDHQKPNLKEIRFKHLFVPGKPSANSQEVLNWLDGKPFKFKYFNLRRTIKNNPNIKIVKNKR